VSSCKILQLGIIKTGLSHQSRRVWRRQGSGVLANGHAIYMGFSSAIFAICCGNYLKLDKLAAIIIGASDLAMLKPAETF
jgi:uncharacterized membrane protein YadS